MQVQVMEPKSVKAEPSASKPHSVSGVMLDLAPLLVFFAVYMTLGIYWATGALMMTTVVAMAWSYLSTGRISATLVITTSLVLGFGGLTFWFSDPSFIKMKPTIINLLFAGVLVAGLAFGRPLLQYVLGHALELTSEGWRKLSWRWVGFFVAMAVLNEIVWRNFSDGVWASFKVFGILPLTMLFFVCQLGLIQRHAPPSEPQPDQIS